MLSHCSRNTSWTIKILVITDLSLIQLFFPKLLENLVAGQLKKHLNDSGITNDIQSAYTNYRTETALLYIHNDLCKAVDTSGAAAVIMLDLSAAFDTFDHSIFLDCFEHLFGLQDNVYLSQIH